MAGTFDPEVYGEAVYSELLIAPEVYGEEPLATTGAAASAGVAAGTGAAGAAKVSLASSAGAGAGTGAAAGASTAASVSAGSTGTGAAAGISASVAPEAGLGSGSGTASDATATTGATTSANAEVATGTGAAADLSSSVSPSSGATGTGAASGAAVAAGINAEAAAGTGAASDVSVIHAANAGLGSGTGAGSAAKAAVSPGSGVAAGTGNAANATGVPAISAAAGVATGTGTVYSTTRTILSNARPSVATGAGRADTARYFATTVVISYNEVDITPDVDIASAMFSAQVNGSPGACSFKVRDDGHTYSFVAGGELTLDINGVRMWGGYLTRAARTYAFPVEDTTGGKDTTAARYWSMQGVDYNILFTKRIIFDNVNPATKLSWDYAVGTYDDTIIKDLFDNYLDIAGDGLRRTGVTRVDVATLDIKGITSGKGSLTRGRGMIANAGYTWKQAMDVIARATGAIYYIDPTRNFHYVDVDTADAAYVLSDMPAVGEKGYREFNLIYNGTNLVNDMLVWGSALGSDTIVFSRSQNTISQTDHGRWQGGLFSNGLYQQASANLVSASYLNGTPQSKRGGKDDAVSLSCKVMGPYFNVGQKVTTEVNIFGYADVLPIRRQEIRFVNPDKPVFNLVLGHDIDQPWSIYEQIFTAMPDYNIKFPRIVYEPPKFKPLVGVGGCTPAICGITDTFTRTITYQRHYNGYTGSGDSLGTAAIPWGTSDSGARWRIQGYWDYTISGGGAGIDGNYASLSMDQGPDGQVYAYLDTTLPRSWTTRTKFRVQDGAYSGGGSPSSLRLVFANGSLTAEVVFIRTGAWQVWWDGGTYNFSGSLGSWKFVEVEYDATTGSVRVRAGDDGTIPAWSAWFGYGLLPANSPGFNFILSGGAGSTGNLVTVEFDNLDITGVNRCTEHRFDNFNRTVASGWGTSDFGTSWSASFTGTGPSVAGDRGVLTAGLNDGALMTVTTPVLGSFDMVSKFKVTGGIPSGGNRLSIQCDLGGDKYVFMGISSGTSQGLVELGGGPGLVSVVKTDWANNTYYMMRMAWNATTGALQFRLWLDSVTEPANWLLETTEVAALAGSLGVGFDNNAGAVGTTTAEFDYIDFDYTGKPCYQTCVGITDTFTRTTSSSTGPGTSDAGPVWGSFSAVPKPYCNGTQLVVPYTKEAIFDFDGVGSNAFEFTYEFVMPSAIKHTWIGGATGSAFVVDATNGLVYCAHGNPPGPLIEDSTTMTIVSGVTWRVRISVSTLHTKVKLWQASSTEPIGWTVQAVATAPTNTAQRIRFSNTQKTESSQADLLIDNLDIVGIQPCSGVPPAVAVSGGTFGYICEIATRTDATHYQLTSQVVPGTTEVFVNGVFQRPGIAREYTVTPTTGVLLFNDPVTDGDVVRVCYQANGPI